MVHIFSTKHSKFLYSLQFQPVMAKPAEADGSSKNDSSQSRGKVSAAAK